MAEVVPISATITLELFVPQAETFLLEGLYIGSLSRHQPPTEVRDWFDDKRVREMLNAHVKRKSMSPKYPTAIILCMAGPLEGAQVRLTPTIWISCGDQRSKSDIKNSVSNATYLNKFRTKFNMREPHVTVNGPETLSGLRISSEAGVHTFEIQVVDDSLDSVCGTSVRFTVQASSDGNTFECYSTIGGLILVDDDVLAITTAHAITKYGMPSLEDIVMDETDDELLATTSTHGITNDEVLNPQNMVIDKTDDSSVLTGSHMREWEHSPFPNTFAYLSDVYVRGVRVDRPVIDTADFALIDSEVLPKLGYNTYHVEGRLHFESVSGYIPTSELSSGDVTICTNDYELPMKGCMVEGDVPIIVGGVVMLTRIIEVAKPAAPGLSGSWVVQRGRLCGVVYAGNASIPYIYIIPAEIMLDDVRKLLGSDAVGVATAQDVSDWKLRHMPYKSFFGSDLETKAPPKPEQTSLHETYQVGDLVRINDSLAASSREVFRVLGGWIDRKGDVQYTLQSSDGSLAAGGKKFSRHQLETVVDQRALLDDGGRESNEYGPDFGHTRDILDDGGREFRQDEPEFVYKKGPSRK